MPQELALYPQLTVGWILSVVAAAAALAFCIGVMFKPSLRNDGWRSPATNMLAGLGCGILAGFYLAISLLDMFGGRSIVLTQEGFTNRNALGQTTRRWETVFDIRVVPGDDELDWLFQQTKISFRDSTEAPPGNNVCCVFTIGGLWGRSDEEIVKALNAWRSSALAGRAQR